MKLRVSLAFALVCVASGADITFKEVFEITGVPQKQERTSSVSGSRVAIDSNDITFLIDPVAKTVTEVDRARAEFYAMPDATFQARLASAREDLRLSMEEDSAARMHWSDVQIDFPDPEPGPRILNLDTKLFRWTFKAKMETTGQKVSTLAPTLTMTNECAIGKPPGWQEIRHLQNVDFGAEALPVAASDEFQKAAKQALDRLGAMEGALLRCTTRAHTVMPPMPGVGAPAMDVETRTEMTFIQPKADPALFRISADYHAVEFPMTPQRMLTYLALPSAALP